MKKAIFPGSFDPFTLGHLDILKKASFLFDKVVVAVGGSISKNYLLDIDQRVELISSVFSNDEKIDVTKFDGLTVNLCKEMEAKFIIRGLRNSNDFEYEKLIALNNKTLNNEIETVFVLSNPSIAHVNSTIVREIIKNKGDVEKFVPKSIAEILKAKHF